VGDEGGGTVGVKVGVARGVEVGAGDGAAVTVSVADGIGVALAEAVRGGDKFIAEMEVEIHDWPCGAVPLQPTAAASTTREVPREVCGRMDSSWSRLCTSKSHMVKVFRNERITVAHGRAQKSSYILERTAAHIVSAAGRWTGGISIR